MNFAQNYSYGRATSWSPFRWVGMSVSNGMDGLVVVTWQRSNKERDTTKMKFFALPMDGSVIKPSGRPKEAWLNKCAFTGGRKI